MKRILSLNNWIVYFIIFSPIVFLISVYNLSFYNSISYGIKFVIETFIQVLTITFLYGMQFFIGRSFYKAIDKKAFFYKINGIIPLLFWLLVCIWLVYNIPDYIRMSNLKQTVTTEEKLPNLLIYLFIFHYLITYFFINNMLVKHELRKMDDSSLQDSLKEKFFKPLNRIVKITWIILLVVLIYVFIYYSITH